MHFMMTGKQETGSLDIVTGLASERQRKICREFRRQKSRIDREQGVMKTRPAGSEAQNSVKTQRSVAVACDAA